MAGGLAAGGVAVFAGRVAVFAGGVAVSARGDSVLAGAGLTGAAFAGLRPAGAPVGTGFAGVAGNFAMLGGAVWTAAVLGGGVGTAGVFAGAL
jgi:hypothetical protein